MQNNKRPFFIHGCSHASGAELPGDTGNGLVREYSWCNGVARSLGFRKIMNQAVPCSSNPHIINETMTWAAQHYMHNPFVLISFTGTDRIYLKSPRQKFKNNESVIRLTPGDVDNPPREAAPELLNMYKELLLTEWGEWRNIQTRFLQEILVLKTFLEKLNVAYLFVSSITPLDSWITKNEQPQAALRSMVESPRLYKSFCQEDDGIYYSTTSKRFPHEIAPRQHIGPQGQLWWQEQIVEYINQHNLLTPA